MVIRNYKVPIVFTLFVLEYSETQFGITCNATLVILAVLKASKYLLLPCDLSRLNRPIALLASGVARNFRQGVRQSVAFLSVHSH